MKNLSFRVDGSEVRLLTDKEAQENNSFGVWAGHNHESGVEGYRWAIWPIGVVYVQICESELAELTKTPRPLQDDDDIYWPAIRAVMRSKVFTDAVKDWPVKPVLPKVYRLKKKTPRAWLVIDGKTHRTAKDSSEETEALLSDWCGYSEPAGDGLYWWYWASNSGHRVCLVNREYRGGPLPADADKARGAFLAVWERVKDKPKYAGIQLPAAYRGASND